MALRVVGGLERASEARGYGESLLAGGGGAHNNEAFTDRSVVPAPAAFARVRACMLANQSSEQALALTALSRRRTDARRARVRRLRRTPQHPGNWRRMQQRHSQICSIKEGIEAA